MAILIAGKVKSKSITKNEEGHCTIKTGLIDQGNIKILNVHVHSNRASKYINQNLQIKKKSTNPQPDLEIS